MFPAYVNYIWRNIESIVRLFADDYIIYRKTINNKDMGKLQIDLNRLWMWAFELEMTIELKIRSFVSREPE
jgi:hypothetical protein